MTPSGGATPTNAPGWASRSARTFIPTPRRWRPAARPTTSRAAAGPDRPAAGGGWTTSTAAPYQLSYPVYYDLEDKYISGVFPSEMAEITQAFFDRLTEYGYTGAPGAVCLLQLGARPHDGSRL